MKRWIISVAVVCLGLLAALVIVRPFSHSANLEGSAVQYAREVLPSIIQDWDPVALRSHFSRKLFATNTEEGTKASTDNYRRQNGDLVRIDSINFQGITSLKSSNTKWYMIRADCTFQLGRTRVWLWLVREDDNWRIDGLTTGWKGADY